MLSQQTVYITVKDVRRPYSEEVMEERIYVLSNKIMGPSYMGRPPKVCVRRSQVIEWNSTFELLDMVNKYERKGYRVKIVE